MIKEYTIYKLINKITDELYIGVTGQKNIKKRLYNNVSKLKLNYTRKLHINMRKYGSKNFTIEPIIKLKTNSTTARAVESYIISSFGIDNLLNENK